MNLKNPFRSGSKAKQDGEPVMDVMRPWWAWGPLGLIWYGGHHSDTPTDPGQIHHPGDAGHFQHHGDAGGGFGGFDGGGGAI